MPRADAMDEDLDARSGRAARGSPAGRGSRRRRRTGRACRTGGRAGPRPPPASMPSCCSRCSTTPGSSSPQRVPIGSPSSAEKPIVVATLRPARSAQSEAPLPRCATTTRPRGDLAAPARAGARRCTRRTGRGSRSGGCPSRPTRAGGRRPAPPPAWCGGRRCRSRRPAAAPARAPAAARIGARLCGWCSGASGTSAASSSSSAGVTRSGRACARPAMHHPVPERASGAAAELVAQPRRAAPSAPRPASRAARPSDVGRRDRVGRRHPSPGCRAARRCRPPGPSRRQCLALEERRTSARRSRR